MSLTASTRSWVLILFWPTTLRVGASSWCATFTSPTTAPGDTTLPSTWVDRSCAGGLKACLDYSRPYSALEKPALALNGFARFVVNRGTAYCFLPSVTALRYVGGF